MTWTKDEIRSAALRQSAEDHGCSPADFEADEHRVVPAGIRKNARVYLPRPAVLDMTTYGRNVVVTCDPALTEDVRALLEKNEEFWQLFAPDGVRALDRLLAPLEAGMSYAVSSFLPDPEALEGFDGVCPFRMRLLGPADFAPLYRPEWSDALSAKRPELDRIGVGAYDGDVLVGLAGASQDCPSMMQIGVNVLPAYRGRGIGSALTNRLAREILAMGQVPFYSAVWANVRSAGNAVRAGFRMAWATVSAVRAHGSGREKGEKEED